MKTLPPPFDGVRFTVRRKVLKLLGAAFHVYDAEERLVMFAEMKALKLKEDIRLYADEARTTELLKIAARQVIDFEATYDVDDARGGRIGSLQRRGLKSMVRDEWRIVAADGGEIGVIQEDSLGLALVRRFLSNLIPQSYAVHVQGRTVATFRQTWNPIVHRLVLDFSADDAGALDRRLGIAAAIALCAIEGRQQ